jgi:glyoxylase-like metal-dependent hydrolase (beta-lactamase superfamily II)
MGDLFTGGFPFIDGYTGGTLDGYILAHEKVLATIDDDTKVIRGHGPLGNKAELQAYHDMLVVVRDRIAKLVKSRKTQEEVLAARPTKEFEEKYGGANFNDARARNAPQEIASRRGALPPNPCPGQDNGPVVRDFRAT